MSITVLIADDHPVVRDGLRLAIQRSAKDILIVGEASDGMEVLEIARKKHVDVFVLDIAMPKLNGIETARELLRASRGAKIVMLSRHDTRAMVVEAFSAGAVGFLTKEIAARSVVDAVTEVHAGGCYLSPSIARFVIEAGLPGRHGARGRATAAAALTAQERKVLQLIAEGSSTKEIADVLGLSVNTIHAHRTRLMAKLNLHRQWDVVRYAIKAGIAEI